MNRSAARTTILVGTRHSVFVPTPFAARGESAAERFLRHGPNAHCRVRQMERHLIGVGRHEVRWHEKHEERVSFEAGNLAYGTDFPEGCLNAFNPRRRIVL